VRPKRSRSNGPCVKSRDQNGDCDKKVLRGRRFSMTTEKIEFLSATQAPSIPLSKNQNRGRQRRDGQSIS
jgi:hypothetical protein